VVILSSGNMKLYHEVLVSYDIEDNKNRKKLFEALKDLGLVSIQKSVFWGHVKVAEEKMLPKLFKRYCSKNDKAFSMRVKFASVVESKGFGYKKEEFEVDNHEYI